MSRLQAAVCITCIIIRVKSAAAKVVYRDLQQYHDLQLPHGGNHNSHPVCVMDKEKLPLWTTPSYRRFQWGEGQESEPGFVGGTQRGGGWGGVVGGVGGVMG